MPVPKIPKHILEAIRAGRMPPPENAARTQIIGTLPTYKKAASVFEREGATGRGLDFGAGLGEGAKVMPGQYETYEPFARGWSPTYSDISQIPQDAYNRLTNLNVLNVVPREARDEIVQGIGRSMEPGGLGIVTTRGADVMKAAGTPGPEPMSIITSRDTYQKGFTPTELQEYLRYMLGQGYDIERLGLGPAGAMIRKKAEGGLAHMAGGSAVAKAAKEAFKNKFTPGFYHGTGSRDIQEFAPGPRGATFVTRQPRFAESFLPIDEKASEAAKDMVYAPGATMYPLSVNLGKHFDYADPAAHRLIESYAKETNATPEVIEGLKTGAWDLMEDPRFMNFLKKHKYDTFAVREMGTKNIGVFDPKNLRGRFAEFDPAQSESADFMKADGGLVYMASGGKTPAWQRKEGQNPEGGLNAAGRASYKRETGGKLKPPVSAEAAKKSPAKAARRKSFCARMSGMAGPMKDESGKPTRKALALRKWDC